MFPGTGAPDRHGSVKVVCTALACFEHNENVAELFNESRQRL